MLLLTVPSLPANLAAMLVAGLVGPWLLVAAITALQRRTPQELLGRVTGVFQLSLGLPQIASIGLGAALIAVVVDYRMRAPRSEPAPPRPELARGRALYLHSVLKPAAAKPEPSDR